MGRPRKDDDIYMNILEACERGATRKELLKKLAPRWGAADVLNARQRLIDLGVLRPAEPGPQGGSRGNAVKEAGMTPRQVNASYAPSHRVNMDSLPMNSPDRYLDLVDARASAGRIVNEALMDFSDIRRCGPRLGPRDPSTARPYGGWGRDQ